MEHLHDIPFERILLGLRSGNVPALVNALGNRDAAEIAEVLCDRNVPRILEALKGGEEDIIIEALMSPDPEKHQQSQTGRRVARAATALRTGDPQRIGSVFRSCDPAAIAHALRSANASELLRSLIPISTEPRKKPLTADSVQLIRESIPEDEEQRVALIDRLLALAPPAQPRPLSTSEAEQIIAALQSHDVDHLGVALNEHYQQIWTDALSLILPTVTRAAQQKLRLAGIGDPSQAAQSIALSVARSFLGGLRKGAFVDYELESLTDLANVLVQIAWRKCCKRLEDHHKLRPLFFPSRPEDSSAQFDIPDPKQDHVRDLIRAEMHDEVAQTIEELLGSLECVDRVILQCKLTEGRKFTHKEIAQRVVEQCDYNRCSERLIQRHWTDIQDQLRTRLTEEPGTDYLG